MLKNWLAAFLAAILVAACGGGGGQPPDSPPTAHPFAGVSQATNKGTLIHGSERKTALAAPQATQPITEEELFAWVEGLRLALFYKGPVTQKAPYLGVEFVYRHYVDTKTFVGVRTSDKAVFVLFADSQPERLEQFGVLADYTCYIRKCDAGGRPTTAGTMAVSGEGGVHILLTPNYVGNKITWLGADGKGFEIPAGDVEYICWRSDRLANWGQRGGVGCSPPESNGVLRVSTIANNDCGRLTLWAKGQPLELWLNFEEAAGWQLASGLNAKKASCGIEYGAGGYTPAKVYAVLETDRTATLVWDFGSDWVGGFFGHDGKPIGFDYPAKKYVFALNGSKTGQDYGQGWGLGNGRKTKEGWDILPSVRLGWIDYQAGGDNANSRFLVRFRNVACVDSVNATVYPQSADPKQPVTEFGMNGFGLGWAGLPSGNNPSPWQAGAGVTFDPQTAQVRYAVPFCKPS